MPALPGSPPIEEAPHARQKTAENRISADVLPAVPATGPVASGVLVLVDAANKDHETRQQAWALPKIGITILLFTGLAMLYRMTPAAQRFEENTSFSFYFSMRQSLGLSPPLDPRLKIFRFDDTTLSTLRKPALNLEEWIRVLEAVDAQRPRAIFIDAMFSIPPDHPGWAPGATPEDVAAAQALVHRWAALRTPIASAAFVTPAKLSRAEIDPTLPPYRLRQYFLSLRSMMDPFPPLIARDNHYAYGPSELLRGILRRAGHAHNGGRGRAKAFFTLRPDFVLPHLALLGTDNIIFQAGQAIVDGTPLPLTQDGHMLVNFPDPRTITQSSRRVSALLDNAKAGVPLSNISAGDFVLILPQSFTGGTDFAETPVGHLPGGYVIASIINSRLAGSWLVEQPYQGIFDLAAAALGALLYLPSSLAALGLLCLILPLWMSFSLFLFCQGNMALGLSSSMLALVGTAVTSIAWRARMHERLRLVVQVLRLQNSQLTDELSQVAEIARILLPENAPSWPGLRIGTYHQSLSAASGDWYGFESSPSGRYRHFIMCDITGHGAQAAIVVATCRTLLSTFAETAPEKLESADFLAEYAANLNLTLLRQGQGQHTTTMLGLSFDSVGGQVMVLCAAHPRAVLVAHDGTVRFVGSSNNLLGLIPISSFALSTYDFVSGDVLVAHTDGLEVPRRLRSLSTLVRAYAHHTPVNIARYVAEDLVKLHHGQGGRPDDDVSLAVFTADADFGEQKAKARPAV